MRKPPTSKAIWRGGLSHAKISLEEAGERGCSPSCAFRQRGRMEVPLRTTNAIERLHGEFKRSGEDPGCALPNAETAAMRVLGLEVASGQITMRRVDGWQHAGPGAGQAGRRLTSLPD